MAKKMSRRFSQFDVMNEAKSKRTSELLIDEDNKQFGDLEYMTGVIPLEKLMPFELLIWRLSRGNAFVRSDEIDPTDYDDHSPLMDNLAPNKVVFIILFQGETIRGKIEKVVTGFKAKLFDCPESNLKKMHGILKIEERLEELRTVIDQTRNHKHLVLETAAKNMMKWKRQVYQIKSIFTTMNTFNYNLSHEAFIAEVWCPEKEIPNIKRAIDEGSRVAGSLIPSILQSMSEEDDANIQLTTAEDKIAMQKRKKKLAKKPTYHRTNKMTVGFQNIVDSYGIANYREINPAPFTIITFPFIFSVMFGDAGHGIIMTLFAMYMIWKEVELKKIVANNEILNTFFGGRYIIFLMGVFSIYSGLIYNDMFSKSLNILGSSWTGSEEKDFNGKDFLLDPAKYYKSDRGPYFFGLDPVRILLVSGLVN